MFQFFLCHSRLDLESVIVFTMRNTTYYVYIITNYTNSVLYIGVSNNLERRMYEHKSKLVEGFSKKYNLKKLIYVETYEYIQDAITREKRLKTWNRQWKLDLIMKTNKELADISMNYEQIPDQVWDDSMRTV